MCLKLELIFLDETGHG